MNFEVNVVGAAEFFVGHQGKHSITGERLPKLTLQIGGRNYNLLESSYYG